MRSRSISARDAMIAQRIRIAVVLALCGAPLAALVVVGVPRSLDELLLHLAATVLPAQLASSLATSAGAVLAGAALASGGVLCGLFEFAGRRLLQRVLLTPLLLPAWYLAILYQHSLGITGPVALAVVLGIGTAPLFQLLITAALRTVPSQYLEVLQQSGRGGPWGVFRNLAPFALPALAASSVLAFLLAWADEASARTFAVPTLTVGLYDQWFGRQDDAAGAPIAIVLLVLSLIPAFGLWAALTRGGFRDSVRLQRRVMDRVRLRGAAAAVPWLLSAPQLAAGVIYPASVVLTWSIDRIDRVRLATIGLDLLHTVLLAAGGTVVAAALALVVLRHQVAAHAPRLAGATARIVLTTFAVPPIVLALAFLWLLPESGEGAWASWLNATPVPLTASVGLRFCAVFVIVGQAALLRVARPHVDVARITGRTDFVSFVRLFAPFVAAPLAAAACFVFLESLQDISLSLVLQPFGFTTISGRLFQYAQTQRIPEGAPWVLCQALVGVYPLSLLARLAETAHDMGVDDASRGEGGGQGNRAGDR
jgi:iron(III) transport system permease protein